MNKNVDYLELFRIFVNMTLMNEREIFSTQLSVYSKHDTITRYVDW